MTEILKVNNNSKNDNLIRHASEVLKGGGTVVFPTETVYGLGANALNKSAVEKIFIAKGRPADNPLIVHIWAISQIEQLVSFIPPVYNLLTKEFWPGPLTLVMRKSDIVPDEVTAGLDTVGIRMPDNAIALELLKQSNIPVAAPSANISGAPSPTSAEHVIKDLNGKVDVIIDGGTCKVGLESTVLDLSDEIPTILRPGGVTAEQIEAVIGHVKIDKFIYDKADSEIHKPRSPGVKYRHYAPKAEVFLIEGKTEKVILEIVERARSLTDKGLKVGILATDQTIMNYDSHFVITAGDRKKPETIAANLFAALREFDEKGIDIILIEAVDRQGIGMAIMNRMLRASGFNVIRVE